MISKVILRKNNRDRRKQRIRGKIVGTPERPRLTIFRSNKYIYGQLIDDTCGKTLVASASEIKEVHKATKKLEAAKKTGQILAEKALKARIKRVVFDRNGYIYAGRVAGFAQGAREGGLEF